MKTLTGKSFRPRQRYAQHFLDDESVIQNIIGALDLVDNSTIVEIGPGQGALTLPLLESLPKLVVIEIDRDLAKHIEQTLGHTDKLHLYQADALKFDFTKEIGGKIQVVGNLPYNISTPLLFHLLDHVPCIVSMLIMLQKEVADRICATHDCKDYGRLSIMVQSLCHTYPLFNVAPESFTPPPKVESSVIKITPFSPKEITVKNRNVLKDIVRTAFSHRRKTVRNALSGIMTEETLDKAGINPSSRPEEISVKTYIHLANIFNKTP
jgi:16S rRNA (adenine1518-N6/adenine1519-N6)-dimethyltransferase